METVIVAFENSKTAWRVKEILEGGGVASCVVCRSADQVRRTLHKLHVPAVVCGYKLGDQTAELLFDDLPLSCAMLVLASQSMLELMQNDDIFRLPTPVSRGDLAASVRMLLQGERAAVEKLLDILREGTVWIAVDQLLTEQVPWEAYPKEGSFWIRY